jgi:hypothetical protein
MKTTAAPLYTDALRLYTHDTGYAVSTEQIPCVGIGVTPAQALTDLLARWRRTRLFPLLAYTHAAEDTPPPPALDYFGGVGALTLRLALVAGVYRYEVQCGTQTTIVEATRETPPGWVPEQAVPPWPP